MIEHMHWEGPGLYASRGRHFAGESYVETRKVESQTDAREQGFGTARWHDKAPSLDTVVVHYA